MSEGGVRKMVYQQLGAESWSKDTPAVADVADLKDGVDDSGVEFGRTRAWQRWTSRFRDGRG